MLLCPSSFQSRFTCDTARKCCIFFLNAIILEPEKRRDEERGENSFFFPSTDIIFSSLFLLHDSLHWCVSLDLISLILLLLLLFHLFVLYSLISSSSPPSSIKHLLPQMIDGSLRKHRKHHAHALLPLLFSFPDPIAKNLLIHIQIG
jgi:hypothetical protein